MNNPPNNSQSPPGWPLGYQPSPPQPVAAADQSFAHQLVMIAARDQLKRQQQQQPVPQSSNHALPNGVHVAYRIAQPSSPSSPHFPQGHQGPSHIAYQQTPPNVQQPTTRWIITNSGLPAHDRRIGNHIPIVPKPLVNSPTAVVTNPTSTHSSPNITTQYPSPAGPHVQSPVQAQHAPNTKEQQLVFQRNNKRLAQLMQEMETEAMFGPACDEFKEWLQDVRAYHASNEIAIMKCAAIVRKNMSYGPWSSMCIFQTLYKFRHYLSELSQRAITTWYNEVCASVTGQSRPTSTQSSPSTSTANVFPQHQLSPQQQSIYLLSGTAPQPSIVQTQRPTTAQQPLVAQPAVTVHNTNIPVPIAIPNITSTIPASSLPQINLQRPSPYQYLHRIEYALAPFRLQHKKVETLLPFFIGRDNFKRIWRQVNLPANAPMPISYVLMAWRNGTPDTKCEWPDTINIEVNGMQPKLARRTKIRVPGRTDNVYQWTGKDKAADLALYLREGKNELMIRQLDCACCYWFSIQVFIRETESVVVNRIMSQVLDINVGRNIISKLLGKGGSREDDDLEVLQPVVRISLKCPISLVRIKTPVKGQKCKHPECFDLHSFLAISVENPKWRCPICNTYIPPDTIYRDAFNEKLLGEVDKHVCEVEYSEDCDHYRISKTDDVEEEELRGQTKSVPQPGMDGCDATREKAPTPVKLEAQTENVISLISDDEDEDDGKQEKKAQSQETARKRTADDHERQETTTPATGSSTEKRARLANDTNQSQTPSNFAPDDMLDRILAFANGGSTR